jgi:hypothetical protein
MDIGYDFLIYLKAFEVPLLIFGFYKSWQKIEPTLERAGSRLITKRI